jgi:hypothetical protein
MQRGALEELLERGFGADLLLYLRFIEPGQPSDDLVKLFPRPALFFDLGHVVRIDRRKGHRGDLLIVLGRGRRHFWVPENKVQPILPP